MIWCGTIVEESLKDNRLVNGLDIVGVRISSDEQPGNRWHLYKVNVNENDIAALSKELKPKGWYMHFWSGDDIVAVFPNKLFHLKYSDKSTWTDAIEYGKSLDIPGEQLDFVIE